jgi:hypothetical protein
MRLTSKDEDRVAVFTIGTDRFDLPLAIMSLSPILSRNIKVTKTTSGTLFITLSPTLLITEAVADPRITKTH